MVGIGLTYSHEKVYSRIGLKLKVPTIQSDFRVSKKKIAEIADASKLSKKKDKK